MISLVEAVKPRLTFFDELRLELRGAVTRHIYLELAALKHVGKCILVLRRSLSR
jgi:hypothetical protein